MKNSLIILLILLIYNFLSAQSLFLQSSGDAINAGDLDIAGDRITIEASFLMTDFNSVNIVSKHVDRGVNNYLFRPFSFEFTTTNQFYLLRVNYPYELNKWYHVTATYDGSHAKYYVNGCLEAEMPASGNLRLNDLPTTIGYSIAIRGEQFYGKIDEVRIWSTVRTPDQIRDNISNLPEPTAQTGLELYYKFDGNYENLQGDPRYDGQAVGNITLDNDEPDIQIPSNIIPLKVATYWQGVLYQGSSQPSFSFGLQINEKENPVKGISTIISRRSTNHGRINFQGKSEDCNLNFQETNIISQQTSPGSRWCIKSANLTYNGNEFRLSGPWQASGCSPGRIELYPLYLESSTCTENGLEVRIFGQNLKWYKDTLDISPVHQGNVYSIPSFQDTIFWISQTYYNIESPRYPINVKQNIKSNIQEGLLAHYPFNGNANDASGNGNNGEISGSTLVTDRFGNPDAAYSFDGVDDIIEIEQTNDLKPSMLSITAWVKGNNPSGVARIVDTYRSQRRTGYSLYYDNNNGKFNFVYWGTSNNYRLASTTDLDNQLHHVTAIFNGTQLSIYVDGTLENIVDAPEAIRYSDRSITIGNGFDDNRFWPFNGSIDEVRIYERALTDCEIEALYFENRTVRDLAITNIDRPSSACDLNDQEEIRIQVQNLGQRTANNVQVSYRVNGGAKVTETIPDPIEADESITYRFQRKADFSDEAFYTIEAFVENSDENEGNNRLEVEIEHYPTPDVTISGESPVCPNQSVTLNASGGTSYRWDNGRSGANLQIRPSTTTTYIVTVTDANNCTAIDSFTVEVFELPDARIIVQGGTELCIGESTTLQANLSENIEWSNGALSDAITVSEAGLYWYTYADESGCTVRSEEVRIIKSTPKEIFVSGGGIICQGESEQLFIPSSTNVSILWSTGETESVISVRPNSSQNYTAIITDNLGCVHYDTFFVEVIPIIEPDAPMNLLPESDILISDAPIEFSWSPAANATRYDFYLWKKGEDRPSSPTDRDIDDIRYTYRRNIEFGSTYAWQVVAKNECTVGGASAIHCFLVEEAPDLRVSDISVNTMPFSGENITVEWQIENIGVGDTRDDRWYDEIYLSRDSIWDNRDTRMGVRRNPKALEPNATYEEMLDYRLSREAEGLYYVIVRTNSDRYGRIQESSYSNNQRSFPIEVRLSPAPDLRVVSGVLPGTDSTVFSSQSDRVLWVIENKGSGATTSSRWRDRVLISQDSIVTDTRNATQIGSYVHNSNLEPDSTYQAITDVLIPARISGRYFIHIQTDYLNDEYEQFLENNNIKNIGVINVIEKKTPDLQPISMTLDTVVSNNEQIILSWVGRNNGADFEGSFFDAFHLSRTPDLSAYVTTLARSFQSQNLPTNTTYQAQTNIRIPNNLHGDYYLIYTIDDGNRIYEMDFEGNNLLAQKIKIQHADLRLDTVRVNATAVSGQTLDVAWVVSNIGQGDIFNQALQEEIYLSSDPVLDFSDRIATVSQTITLKSREAATRQATVTIPEGLAGNYFLFVHSNRNRGIYENGLVNNNISAAIPIQILEGNYPNLVAEEAMVSSTELQQGERLSLSVQVANRSEVDLLSNWTDEVFISNSPVWVGAINAIGLGGEYRSQQLLANTSYSDEISVRIPTFLRDGNYYLYYLVDAQNRIYENNLETDNIIRSDVIRVKRNSDDGGDGGTRKIVDLNLVDLRLPCEIALGQSIRLSWEVRNNGNHKTFIDSWTDGLYLSRDTEWDASDRLVQQWRKEGTLFPGRTYKRIENFTLPADISGEYYLIIVSDNQQLTDDNNRANNLRIFQPSDDCGDGGGGIIAFPPKPDLTISQPQLLTSPAYAGQKVQLRFTVTNIGEVDAPPVWIDRIRLSSDPTIGTGDIIVYTEYNNNQILASNESYTKTVEALLPSAASGNYFLIFSTDDFGGLTEGDEGNNRIALPIQIEQLPPADLIVENVRMDAEVTLGESLNVNWLVKNIGVNEAIGGKRDGVYISADQILDASDVYLGGVDNNINLGQNESSTASGSFEVNGVRLGAYFIIVKTDILDNIREDNEINNSTASIGKLLVKVPELPLNTWVGATLERQQPKYYRIEIPESLSGEFLQVLLEGGTTQASNEIYLAYERIPSRASFDHAFDTPFSPDQRLVVPNLRAGTYYLMVYGDGVPIQNVRLNAQIVEFELTGINTSVGGNTGNVTSKLFGNRLEASLQVWLENASGEKIFGSFTYDSPTRGLVTFPLDGAALGYYDVVASNSRGQISKLENGYLVVTGTAGSDEDLRETLEIEYAHPPSVRADRVFSITVCVENTGNIDVRAPHRIICALNGIPISSTPEGLDAKSSDLLYEFTEKDCPTNVLRPGTRVCRVFYAKASRNLTRAYFKIKK
ncbi:MAG: CARDB domain-containing protein, partial [Bacteroidota bacterium]